MYNNNGRCLQDTARLNSYIMNAWLFSQLSANLLRRLTRYPRIDYAVLQIGAVVLDYRHLLYGYELEALFYKGRDDLLCGFGRGLIEVVHQDDVAVLDLADDGSAYLVCVPALPVT